MNGSLRQIILASSAVALLLSPVAAFAQTAPRPPHQQLQDSKMQPAHPQKPAAPHQRNAMPPKPQAVPPHAPQHQPRHVQQQYKPHYAQPGKPHHAQPPKAHGVRPGQYAGQARPFQRGKNSRFAAPPRGQDYRVYNDHLVLVDNKTLQVVTVLGLLNTLLR